MTGLAILGGPVVGGAVAEGISWPWIFWLNVPIGLVLAPLARRVLTESRGPANRLDLPGIGLAGAGLLGVVYGLVRGQALGWTSTTVLGCYAAAIALFAAFVPVELRRKFPMFDLKLFKNPTFIGSSVSAFTVAFSVMSLIVFAATWFQSILGYSAIVGIAVVAAAGKQQQRVVNRGPEGPGRPQGPAPEPGTSGVIVTARLHRELPEPIVAPPA